MCIARTFSVSAHDRTHQLELSGNNWPPWAFLDSISLYAFGSFRAAHGLVKASIIQDLVIELFITDLSTRSIPHPREFIHSGKFSAIVGTHRSGLFSQKSLNSSDVQSRIDGCIKYLVCVRN